MPALPILLGLIFLGGGLGATARFGLSYAVGLAVGPAHPHLGTLLCNLLGSLAIGVVTAWLAGQPAGSQAVLKALLVTGLLGGFTTFSSFSLETVNLYLTGQARAAALNAAVSLFLCLLATGVGLWAGLKFRGPLPGA